MSNGKAVITLLIVALIKKILLYKMSYYYPEANTRIKSKKAVSQNFSNYPTNLDFPKKVDLGGWKWDVKKSGIDKPVKVSRGSNGLESKAHNLDFINGKIFVVI